MTVKETLECGAYKGKYDFVEIYVATGSGAKHFHTDSIDSYNPNQGYGDCPKGQEDRLNSYCLNYEVEAESLMDCEDYNNSVLANSCMTTTDFGWNGTEKILCLLISRKSIAKGEDFGL